MQQAMPPRSGLTSSFSVSDQSHEVVCPLKNNDGTNCRKRCLGVSSLPSTCPPRALFASACRAFGDAYRADRKNDIAPCKSTFDERIQNTIFQSFQPPRRASSS